MSSSDSDDLLPAAYFWNKKERFTTPRVAQTKLTSREDTTLASGNIREHRDDVCHSAKPKNVPQDSSSLVEHTLTSSATNSMGCGAVLKERSELHAKPPSGPVFSNRKSPPSQSSSTNYHPVKRKILKAQTKMTKLKRNRTSQQDSIDDNYIRQPHAGQKAPQDASIHRDLGPAELFKDASRTVPAPVVINLDSDTESDSDTLSNQTLPAKPGNTCRPGISLIEAGNHDDDFEILASPRQRCGAFVSQGKNPLTDAQKSASLDQSRFGSRQVIKESTEHPNLHNSIEKTNCQVSNPSSTDFEMDGSDSAVSDSLIRPECVKRNSSERQLVNPLNSSSGTVKASSSSSSSDSDDDSIFANLKPKFKRRRKKSISTVPKRKKGNSSFQSSHRFGSDIHDSSSDSDVLVKSFVPRHSEAKQSNKQSSFKFSFEKANNSPQKQKRNQVQYSGGRASNVSSVAVIDNSAQDNPAAHSKTWSHCDARFQNKTHGVKSSCNVSVRDILKDHSVLQERCKQHKLSAVILNHPEPTTDDKLSNAQSSAVVDAGGKGKLMGCDTGIVLETEESLSDIEKHSPASGDDDVAALLDLSQLSDNDMDVTTVPQTQAHHHTATLKCLNKTKHALGKDIVMSGTRQDPVHEGSNTGSESDIDTAVMSPSPQDTEELVDVVGISPPFDHHSGTEPDSVPETQMSQTHSGLERLPSSVCQAALLKYQCNKESHCKQNNGSQYLNEEKEDSQLIAVGNAGHEFVKGPQCDSHQVSTVQPSRAGSMSKSRSMDDSTQLDSEDDIFEDMDACLLDEYPQHKAATQAINMSCKSCMMPKLCLRDIVQNTSWRILQCEANNITADVTLPLKVNPSQISSNTSGSVVTYGRSTSKADSELEIDVVGTDSSEMVGNYSARVKTTSEFIASELGWPQGEATSTASGQTQNVRSVKGDNIQEDTTAFDTSDQDIIKLLESQDLSNGFNKHAFVPSQTKTESGNLPGFANPQLSPLRNHPFSQVLLGSPSSTTGNQQTSTPRLASASKSKWLQEGKVSQDRIEVTETDRSAGKQNKQPTEGASVYKSPRLCAIGAKDALSGAELDESILLLTEDSSFEADLDENSPVLNSKNKPFIHKDSDLEQEDIQLTKARNMVIDNKSHIQRCFQPSPVSDAKSSYINNNAPVKCSVVDNGDDMHWEDSPVDDAELLATAKAVEHSQLQTKEIETDLPKEIDGDPSSNLFNTISMKCASESDSSYRRLKATVIEQITAEVNKSPFPEHSIWAKPVIGSAVKSSSSNEPTSKIGGLVAIGDPFLSEDDDDALWETELEEEAVVNKDTDIQNDKADTDDQSADEDLMFSQIDCDLIVLSDDDNDVALVPVPEVVIKKEPGVEDEPEISDDMPMFSDSDDDLELIAIDYWDVGVSKVKVKKEDSSWWDDDTFSQIPRDEEPSSPVPSLSLAHSAQEDDFPASDKALKLHRDKVVESKSAPFTNDNDMEIADVLDAAVNTKGDTHHGEGRSSEEDSMHTNSKAVIEIPHKPEGEPKDNQEQILGKKSDVTLSQAVKATGHREVTEAPPSEPDLGAIKYAFGSDEEIDVVAPDKTPACDVIDISDEITVVSDDSDVDMLEAKKKPKSKQLESVSSDDEDQIALDFDFDGMSDKEFAEEFNKRYGSQTDELSTNMEVGKHVPPLAEELPDVTMKKKLMPAHQQIKRSHNKSLKLKLNKPKEPKYGSANKVEIVERSTHHFTDVKDKDFKRPEIHHKFMETKKSTSYAHSDKPQSSKSSINVASNPWKISKDRVSELNRSLKKYGRNLNRSKQAPTLKSYSNRGDIPSTPISQGILQAKQLMRQRLRDLALRNKAAKNVSDDQPNQQEEPVVGNAQDSEGSQYIETTEKTSKSLMLQDYRLQEKRVAEEIKKKAEVSNKKTDPKLSNSEKKHKSESSKSSSSSRSHNNDKKHSHRSEKSGKVSHEKNKSRKDRPHNEKSGIDKHGKDQSRKDNDKKSKHRMDTDDRDKQRKDSDKRDQHRKDNNKTDQHRKDNNKTDKHRKDNNKTDKHRKDNDKKEQHSKDKNAGETSSKDNHRREKKTRDSHKKDPSGRDTETSNMSDKTKASKCSREQENKTCGKDNKRPPRVKDTTLSDRKHSTAKGSSTRKPSPSATPLPGSTCMDNILRDMGQVINNQTPIEHGNKQLDPIGQRSKTGAVAIREEDFLASLLHWSPHWLEEQRKARNENKKGLPPLLDGHSLPGLSSGKKARLYPLLETGYSSFQEYLTILLPLLLYETWAGLYSDWSKMRSPFEFQMVQTAPFRVDSRSGKIQTGSFQCILSHAEMCRDGAPKEGGLLTLQVSTKLEGKACKKIPVLAYVSKLIWGGARGHRQLSEKLAKSEKLNEQGCKLGQATIKIYRREKVEVCDPWVTAKLLGSITTTMRQLNGVLALEESSLLSDILRPDNYAQVFDHAPPAQPVHLDGLNPSQLDIVLSVTHAVLQPQQVPKICLIQGPPGTGKSHTIISLIKNILSQNTPVGGRPHILLTAPSNAAVDELMKRLIKDKLTSRGNVRPLQLVRVGRTVHKKLLEYGLDELVMVEAKMEETRGLPESVRMELATMQRRLDNLDENLKYTKDGREQRNLRNERDKLVKKINQLGGRPMTASRKELNYFELMRLRKKVLMKMDVVCSTLNGTGIGWLKDMLQRGVDNRPFFTCCIVDEACQTTEVDCLIPLQYGTTKLVLVGDPQQLPATVLSTKAEEFNFGQSLFERFFNYFKDVPIPPVKMLTTQYRMHWEICFFPSFHMYEGMLKTDPSVLDRSRCSPFRPYALFDLCYGQEEQQGTGVQNLSEVEFLSDLCGFLHYHGVKKEAIGIISPYQQQKFAIKRALGNKQLDIEVDTVDSFQGREKDIIIFTCVRANSDSGTIGFLKEHRRLNVALTRARYAMYVIGHLATLKVNHDFQSLIEDAQRRQHVIPVQSPRERYFNEWLMPRHGHR